MWLLLQVTSITIRRHNTTANTQDNLVWRERKSYSVTHLFPWCLLHGFHHLEHRVTCSCSQVVNLQTQQCDVNTQQTRKCVLKSFLVCILFSHVPCTRSRPSASSKLLCVLLQDLQRGYNLARLARERKLCLQDSLIKMCNDSLVSPERTNSICALRLKVFFFITCPIKCVIVIPKNIEKLSSSNGNLRGR